MRREVAKIYPNRVQVFTLSDHRRAPQLENIKSRNYHGEVTASVQKKIKACVQLLVAQAKPKIYYIKGGTRLSFRVNFITLTLPSNQIHSDKEIKRRCFDLWLKKVKLHAYIWKAERQKNGNLHFHVTSDTYVHYDRVRDSWNTSLELLGYITRFREIHGHGNPNSTDIHATKNIKNLAAYLAKYFTKKGEKIDGKVWGASDNLTSNLNHYEEIDSGISDDIQFLFTRKAQELHKSDHCTGWYSKSEETFLKELRNTNRLYKSYSRLLELVRV